jgi:hypothetical protein
MTRGENAFFRGEPGNDPRSHFSLRGGQNPEVAGGAVDYDAILRDALRNRTCAECGVDLDHRRTPRSGFCSHQHYYRWRDRLRYASDPEGQRERSRRYYRENREKVLEKAAARRGRARPRERSTCEECGAELVGQQRNTCGKSSCRDRRFKRTNPEGYERREAAKVERRREKRRAQRAQSADEGDW